MAIEAESRQCHMVIPHYPHPWGPTDVVNLPYACPGLDPDQAEKRRAAAELALQLQEAAEKIAENPGPSPDKVLTDEQVLERFISTFSSKEDGRFLFAAWMAKHDREVRKKEALAAADDVPFSLWTTYGRAPNRVVEGFIEWLRERAEKIEKGWR